MANILGKIAKTGKEKFTQRDSKLNFSISENIVTYQGINGKKDDSNLCLNEHNFRLQIGKMDKNNETIYTKEIVIPALAYILKKTGNNQKAIIQLRPDLAKYLTNENQKEESKKILSFEEEKTKIMKLIKKYFKNKADRIRIVNVSSSYEDIFSLLKEKGKDGLDSTEKPILISENFSALLVVKYLYRTSQHNKALMQLLYNTKTIVQQKEDIHPIGENQSDYYSLVEIGIRLYEVLSGISIQGGVDRQSKYDKIIGGILQWKDIPPFKRKDYPELKELHDFCSQINSDVVFERLWISTKEVREVTEKKQYLSKFKTITLATSLMLMGALVGGIGGYKIFQQKQKKEQEQKSEMELKKSLKDKYTTNVYYDNRERSDPNATLRRVKEASDEAYVSFLKIYGIGNANDEQLMIFKSYLEQYFSEAESDSSSKLIHLDSVYDDFIRSEKLQKEIKNIVHHNRKFFTDLGFDLMPHENVIGYTETMKYTSELEGDIGINFHETTGTETALHVAYDSTKYQKKYNELIKNQKKYITVSLHTYNYKRIGPYLHANGKMYDILMIWGHDDKKFFVASEHGVGENFNPGKNHLYTKENGELIAKDYLVNRIKE